LHLNDQFEYLPKFVAVPLLGESTSPEAVRCKTRRLKARGLLDSADAGPFTYSFLTEKGARAIGVAPPKRRGHAGLYVRFAIAEFCARNDKSLLRQAEFLELLSSLEPHFGELAVPGLLRRRWFVSADRVHLIEVDLSLGSSTGTQLVARVSERVSKLKRKTPGWEKLISDGRLSAVLLSSSNRAAEIAAARRASNVSVPIQCFATPVLSHVGCNAEEATRD